MSEPTTTTTTLRTALGRHAVAAAIADGSVHDDRVDLDLVEVDPIHRAFAPMVREQAFDVSELAIVTALQAVAYGHPVVLLPIVVAARFQRRCLISHADRPIRDPRELIGGRIGVRSYTQTTGLWIRTHLRDDHGIQAADSTWITQDPAHVPEYQEPDFVERTLEGGLVDALRSGEVDAAILGNDLPSGDEFVPVIRDAVELDRVWYDEHGYVPINHVVSVSQAAFDRDPDAMRGLWSVLARAQERTAAAPPTPTMAGLERLTGPIDEIAESCAAQGMLPRAVSADEVFAPFRRMLDRTA